MYVHAHTRVHTFIKMREKDKTNLAKCYNWCIWHMEILVLCLQLFWKFERIRKTKK